MRASFSSSELILRWARSATPTLMSSREFVEQRVVRDTAPDEQREPRRKRCAVDAVHRARRRGRRGSAPAKQELGAAQDAREAS